MSQHTVTLVEDDPDVLQRLSSLITDDDDLVLLEASASYTDGLKALLHHKPDVLLTDLRLPDGSGIDIIRAIDKNHLDTQAMVVSGFQDEHNVFTALEVGAQGYIHKHDKWQDISNAIASMLAGGAPMSPVIARLMLQKFQRPPEITQGLPEALTERQTRIIKLLSQGFSSREIAERLSISYYTVTTHIKNIYTKLQVNSRTEALHEARKLGLF